VYISTFFAAAVVVVLHDVCGSRGGGLYWFCYGLTAVGPKKKRKKILIHPFASVFTFRVSVTHRKSDHQ